MNSISSTSFSREGKNFTFMKYIPVSYQTQLFVKYLISFLISFIGIFMYMFVFFVIIRLNFITSLIYTLMIILCISLVNFIGMFIDSLQPKLYWDDENNALRENYNTFIAMGISLLLLIVLCIGSYSYLFKKLDYTFNQVYLLILSILLMLNVIMYLVNRTVTIKNIIEQE
jgi:ABC-2 type transport system permease protein